MEKNEKHMLGALTAYRECGAFLRRREQFEHAMAAYDTAYEVAPEDMRLLLGRGLVGIDAVRPQQALADAEAALRLQPANVAARYIRARALHAMSDFERALVMHSRGERIRKQPPYFREGHDLGVSTVKTCIGKNTHGVLLANLGIIKNMETAKTIEQDYDVNRTRKSRIPHHQQTHKLTQTEVFKHKTLSQVLAMKYLGPMASDKFFLQDLGNDPRLKGANSAGSKKLYQLAEEALRTLTERQEMLRCLRPYYAIRLSEKTESKHQTEYEKQLLQKDRKINTYTAERLMKQIEVSTRANHIREMATKAERMRVFLDSKTPRTLPEKEHYTERLCRAIGEGYLAQHRLSKKGERGVRRRVAFLMSLPVGRPTSYDSVIANYPHRFHDARQALEKLKNTLEVCENPFMKCWLMYEISYLLNKQKNHSLAKFYAKRCQRVAQDVGSTTWWLNACFILVSGEMQEGNANEVRALVEQAYEYSKKIKDAERVQEFLQRCARMASEVHHEVETHATAHRQKQILRVMDESLRDDTKVLFKRIATLPTARRFSVLPLKLTKDMPPVRRRCRQHGLSIVPGQEKGLPVQPRTKVLGLQQFDF